MGLGTGSIDSVRAHCPVGSSRCRHVPLVTRMGHDSPLLQLPWWPMVQDFEAVRRSRASMTVGQTSIS
jgi:hypothetical protein